MAKERKLGKGLNELLSKTIGSPEGAAMYAPAVPPETAKPEAGAVVDADSDATKPFASSALHYLPVEKLGPSQFQPRQTLSPESVQQLASSIKNQGVLQPIVVRPTQNDRYEIIAGERRWRASKQAGLTEIPAIVRSLTDDDALAIALIENIQREDLNPIEQAKALRRLTEERNLTHLEVADLIGKSRTAVTNLIRLLVLHPQVQSMLEAGALDMGHARALLGLKGPMQVQVAKTVVTRRLSVRETERIVNKILDPEKRSPAPTPGSDPNITRLEHNLSDKLGAAVAIRHSNTGPGTLVIRYNDVNELQGIINHLVPEGTTESA